MSCEAAAYAEEEFATETDVKFASLPFLVNARQPMTINASHEEFLAPLFSIGDL